MDKPKRPEAYDKAIKEAAAVAIAERLIKELPSMFEEHDKSSLVSDLAKCSCRDDGYEIGKDIERHHGWHVDFETCAILDCFRHQCDVKAREAAKQWAIDNDIRPAFAPGSRVKISSGETGTIDRVYEHGAAEYAVKLDGDTMEGRFRIVRFEDAEAA